MHWKKMTTDEYAQFQHEYGVNTVKTNDIWWAEVKPCFYRPLLPWQELMPTDVQYPTKSIIGGVQHAVPKGIECNSQFNLFFFEDLQNYSLDVLCSKRRNMVKKGLRHFNWKQLYNIDEFKNQAYPVYLSFYARTKYRYKKERLQKDHFDSWTEKIFANPKSLILGAYKGNQLSGVNVSYRVDDVIIGATFFADTDSLSLGVSDFFIHTLRELASKTDASRIFYGWATGERGLDEFKLVRGCKLEKLPAWFHINPTAMLMAKCFMKYNLSKIIGNFI